jgi:four helix bundle protein
MAEELKHRTKLFALSILDVVERLPFHTSAKVVSYQIAKSATSVGANYRAACRARSDREFIAKMEIVLEEADETLYWLEIIVARQWIDKLWLESIWNEGNELTAIFVSTLKKVKARVNS